MSGFGVKNKPKIRICQSGTDMQTITTRLESCVWIVWSAEQTCDITLC